MQFIRKAVSNQSREQPITCLAQAHTKYDRPDYLAMGDWLMTPATIASNTEDQANVLFEQCMKYLAMIDALDMQLVTLVVACLGFVGVVLGLVFSVANRSRDDEKRRGRDSKIASLLLLLVPSTTSMLVYVIALFSRRVATYRGYAAACEDMWNSIEGHAALVYNGSVVDEFYKMKLGSISHIFLTNTGGPALMGLLILALFVGSFYASWQLFHVTAGEGQDVDSSGPYKQIDAIYPKAFWLLVAICALVSAFAVIDLSMNGSIMEEVRGFALNLLC